MSKQKDIDTILYWLLEEKHNLDNGICEQITGRADKDYLLGLKNIVNKASTLILSKLKTETVDRKKVEKIIYHIEREILDLVTINLSNIATEWNDILQEAITQICQLSPLRQKEHKDKKAVIEDDC